ncbi:MAG: SSI family serine proteinase inhibitor [Actinomycetota bacterium]
MKVLLLAIVALAATGCMGRTASSGGGSAEGTSLKISISLGAGKGAPTKLWTLQCPKGGTLPDASQACAKLDRLADPFGPVPKNLSCTEVFGGPQVATVQGTFRGQPVNTEFSRSDGCQIARWNRVRFLFPSA